MANTSAADRFLALAAEQLDPKVLQPPQPRYLQEPRGIFAGQCAALALPRTVQEVATLVRLAGQAGLGIVPYGGGTGLVGGQVAPDGPAPLILSLERMNAIRSVHPAEDILIAEAGAILADVQAAAQDAGRLFPLSLASEGSARIGGTLSTNAGGTNVLRYGNARDLCLGLEAVLPDGTVWNGLRRLRKDNTGYDLRNLLIGAEGTLGVITAAALRLFPRPHGTGTAILTVGSPAQALDLLALARSQVGELISAFELIHGAGLTFLADTLPDVRQPFDQPPAWCVLIEVGLPIGMDPQDILERLFTEGHARGLVEDGVIAQNARQAEAFWAVREHIPEANRLIGAVSSHDISVPLAFVPGFISKASDQIAALGAYRINCFGHLGDGNLHFNVFAPKGGARADFAHHRAAIKGVVHDVVAQFDGSISAEHGIGRLKVADLEHFGDPAKLAAMRAIKGALDPKGIMNPGAVLRL